MPNPVTLLAWLIPLILLALAGVIYLIRKESVRQIREQYFPAVPKLPPARWRIPTAWLFFFAACAFAFDSSTILWFYAMILIGDVIRGKRHRQEVGLEKRRKQLLIVAGFGVAFVILLFAFPGFWRTLPGEAMILVPLGFFVLRLFVHDMKLFRSLRHDTEQVNR
ncbi:MAG TPA: hypothetical protein VHY22_06110 [Chthoniobacteraceae bacterium]|jgi:hypothetical protein|nr:hypothetical protein [Chthoniobacteraceae bacterium]